MGDVVTALGRAVQEEGHKVEVILPKYDCIQYDEVGLPCGNITFAERPQPLCLYCSYNFVDVKFTKKLRVSCCQTLTAAK